MAVYYLAVRKSSKDKFQFWTIVGLPPENNETELEPLAMDEELLKINFANAVKKYGQDNVRVFQGVNIECRVDVELKIVREVAA